MAPTRTQLLNALRQFRSLLEIDGANTFKVNAYVRAIRVLGDESIDIGERVENGDLTDIDGIGKGIAEKVEEFWNDGKIAELDELANKYPPGLVEMTEIPGFGAKKTRAVYEELGVESIDQLASACEDGRVAELKGFGKKTAEKVLTGIEQLKKHSGRFRIDVAWKASRPILEMLRDMKEVERVEVAGSLRRWRETAKDLDFVCATDKPSAVIDAFVDSSGVERVTGKGDTKASVVLDSGMAADLRCVSAEEFPFALQYFSGSKEHNTKLRGIAREKKLKLNEYGLFPDGKEKSLKAESEEDIYKHLGLAYIEPELREDMGEIDSARDGKLPKLVERGDLRGLMHNHTKYSDGEPEVEDYAQWAVDNDIEWIGIADHSQAAAYAGGLSPKAVEHQWKEIDAANKKYKKKGVRLLKGIESDILADGSLDYDEELLSGFEYVVASVHSNFNFDEKKQTKRIRTALENPFTTILGHMTGRLLLKRDGYNVAQKEIIEAAGKLGVIIEINADPHRLDIDWRLIRYAMDCGCLLSIGPDAHRMAGMENVRYGLGIARKGWVEKKNLVNCLSCDEFLKLAAKRRS